MRFILLSLFILVGVLPIIIYENVLLANYENKLVSKKIIEVQNQSNIIVDQLLTYNYMSDQSSAYINAELSLLSDVNNGRIMIIDEEFNIVKDTYTIETDKYMVSEPVMEAFRGNTSSNYDSKNDIIEIYIPVYDDADAIKSIVGVMIVSASTDAIAIEVSELSRNALVLEIIFIIFIVGIAIILSKTLVKPYNRIVESIDNIAEGYLNEDVEVSTYLETTQISEAFNKMMEKAKALDQSRNEFVSNVSHELKTPITSIKVLADSLIMQDEVPVELYKEFLNDIADEIDRESKIINDLLSLVKMDKTASDLNIAQVNINELLELILKRLRPIAARRNIELVFESFRPVVAEIDEVKLTLALSNLVENAIKYNVENGWVRVSLNADHKYFYVKVSDSGIGIPSECQDKVFERFYRVDKARSRETGGTGLGLSITRNAILMHRGAIKLYSKEDEGTTFTVRVPLTYIA